MHSGSEQRAKIREIFVFSSVLERQVEIYTLYWMKFQYENVFSIWKCTRTNLMILSRSGLEEVKCYVNVCLVESTTAEYLVVVNVKEESGRPPLSHNLNYYYL